MELFQKDRHELIVATPWNEAETRRAIGEIATDAVAHFDPEKLWPSHPLDGVPDGMANLYFGAMGNILALDHLTREGAIAEAFDFRPLLPGLIERDTLWLRNVPLGVYGSLLMGDLGTLLAAERLAPDRATADRIFARAWDNNALPPLEMMWGTPGSMLACVFMHTLTSDARFAKLYRLQAQRLLDDVQDAGACRLWAQDLYGKHFRFLGLVHGFAGNALALLKGWQWLDGQQQQNARTLLSDMLAATARHEGQAANWPADAENPDAPMLSQICHGAPGIVTGFAEAPFSSPEFERLLVEGGELIWAAGPLKKGSNFCHGTGGNAYALLKLYKRTGDAKWLERARAFAMTAIAQWRAATAEHGKMRYSLWTGDSGLALCLWSCIKAEPKFPALDAI